MIRKQAEASLRVKGSGVNVLILEFSNANRFYASLYK